MFSLFLFVFKADIDYIYIHQYKKMISLLYNIVLTCRARILECYSVLIQIKASLLVIHRLSWAFKSFQLYFNYIVTSGFNWGNQDRTWRLSILHARLRHQWSSLNSDLHRINITNDPKCQCGAPYEDSIHYLMECPLYQNERYCLFRNLRETSKNIETLLFGNDEISINENSNIFNKVRAYIRQTKRL
jgi:hypothetical protein